MDSDSSDQKLTPRDLSTLRQRRFYEKHREEVKKRNLDAYHARRAKLAEQGVTLRPRGRPRRNIPIPNPPTAESPAVEA